MTATESVPATTASSISSSTAGVTTDTTRIFVSGLPPKFTSDQLKQHFGSQFRVTDAHVLADRRIGFVGFADSSAAQNAAKHFDKSYIRMSKISVDLARPVQISRDSAGNAVPVSHKRHKTRAEEQSKKRKRSRDDDGEDVRSSEAKTDKQINDQPNAVQTVSAEHDNDDAEPTEPAATDRDWLRGRTNRTLDLVDPDEVKIRQDDEPGQEIPATKPDVPPNPEAVEQENPRTVHVPNARLFLRNLAFLVTEEDLQAHFQQYGKIHELHLVKDARTSTSKGTAFIQFAEPHEAEAALEQSDGITFQGRLMHILPASDKRDKGLTEYEISQMPLKKQKAVRRKLEAAKQTFSWNSLYMNPDAVLSSIADRLGVNKADILDPTSADAAVSQAHAETQLIKETKQYLTSAGVNVDAFKNRSRDDRCLLLKNFPYGTTEAELRALLEPFGTLTKFILPPAGTMALVQYDSSYPASEALKHLAYKNVKGSVLYLEKAPQDILDTPDKSHETDTIAEPAAPAIATAPAPAPSPASTVFVKNLNFSTTTARLQEIAGSLPGFISARVKTRTDSKRPGQLLSMGFGFLEFRSKQEAEAAVKALSGHQLDGHQLIAQLSTKATDAAEETRKHDQHRKKNANQTKIIIKNLPFQASKKDIRSLFAQYGELKMVRVPRKFDHSTRGFAFAEFVTPKEAENAMDALSDTHLLGRRLVLQFAEGDAVDPEEEIRAIEKKVEQQSARIHYNNLKGPGRKKFNLETARDDGLDT